ncbi:unnamed protein product [Effrenium voratum]|nr:unnamed protein product [Effrenium voratum]
MISRSKEGGDFVVPPSAPPNPDSQGKRSCWPCSSVEPSPVERKAEEKTLMDTQGTAPGQLIEEAYLCRRRKGGAWPSQARAFRVGKLLQRMEREGMDSERLLVPAFEDEARSLEQKEAREDAIKKETAHQMEFRKRIQERTRRMATVKTHMSYKSIVREYGEEAEEGNFLELLERFQQFFQPKRTLRPSGARRRFESSVKVIRVHVSVAKVYDAPLRVDHTAPSAPAAPAPPGFSSAGGYPSFGLPPRPLDMVFGAQPEGVQKHQLPEIVIELTLQDFQGNLLFRRTDRAAKSTDPDINQILELPLHGEKDDLTQENLTKYSGELTINIFDELTQATSSGKDLRLRTQLRHLGRFVVPWDTLYSAKCSLKGHFLVDQYPVLFGYRPKARKKPPGDAGTLEKPRSMCLALDVTVDPPLEHPTRVQPQITLGKEPNMMLKHIQKWNESLKSKHNTRILALGMDVDGRSRLICRYIRPQRPPDHIPPEDPFAIEMAARYVALVPSLQDNEMWNVEDLWCTDQEFLDIQCGDWEEHCILLCNYFNYIDRYRRAQVPGYSSTDIQSYCVICDLVPEGEAVVVLRKDHGTGNCEFWHALKGKCFFLPATHRSGWSLCGEETLTRALNSEADASRSTVMEASATVPIRRVHVVFNAENVWANLQRNVRDAHKGGAAISWDLEDTRRWKPLFSRREEFRRLSGLAPGEVDALDPRHSWQLEDAAEALKYQPADPAQATRLESMLQSQLEQDIINHRAGLGATEGHSSHSTKFNHIIGDKLGQLLERLEMFSNCSRLGTGLESSFPLRSSAAMPVTRQAIEEQMQDFENDLRIGRSGRSVFGVPFNEPYKDYSLIWDGVKQSRVLELGGDRADFALKVRVFPYACGVLSIWVFIAVAMGED